MDTMAVMSGSHGYIAASSPDLPRLLITALDLKAGRPGQVAVTEGAVTCE